MSFPTGFRRLAVVALLVLVALGFAAGPASAARPFSTSVTVTDIGNNEQLGYDRIKDAGASFTRVTVIWASVAPDNEPSGWNPSDPSDSHYDWSTADLDVQRAVDAGLKPLVQIFHGPRWALRCKDQTPGICNPDPKAFARFATAAAKRYSGTFNGLPRVRYWEPWNEPNLASNFRPQLKGKRKVSPKLYRSLLNPFYSAIKKVDPGNTVVAGGLAPLGGTGSVSPLDFARRVLCMQGRSHPKPTPRCGARASFDIWATNAYTTGGPTHESFAPDDLQLGDLPEMSKLLRAARHAGKIRTKVKKVNFWVTEFSWDSSPPDPGGVPMGLLTRWTSEAMFRSWQAGVSNFFWLSLRDWQRDPGTSFAASVQSGLYFRGSTLAEDRPKRNLKAFRFPFVAFTKSGGISVWGRTPDSSAGRVSLSFKSGGKWRKLGTVKADSHGVFQSKIRTKLGKNRRGSVRAKFGDEISPAFSLRLVPDRSQNPFG